LLVDQLVKLRIAVSGVVAIGAAHIIFVEELVGVVESNFGDRKTDGVVLANDFGEPDSGIDGIELATDVDIPQLADED
jgi:hypothetical protein